jgi:Derlin-2/3
MLAFVYTSSQDDRGQMTTFYMVTIPSQWMPWAMLLVAWLMAGKDQAIIGLTGIIAAHLHDFLTRIWPEIGGGSNLLPTPGFIRRMWETKTATVTHKSYGTAFARPQRKDNENSGGPLPESWKSRGSGHRLGGD